MRVAGVVSAVLVAVAMLAVIAGVAAKPLSRTCAPTVTEDVCAETVEAALKRGLAPLHPLILGSHVEPGPAAASAELGHKATVTFDLLGVPGPTSVRLYLDMGGHWGGEADRSPEELALWWALPAAMLMAAAGGALVVGWRKRSSSGDPPIS